jgi:5-methyltetrahydropteroyltriglutamate--homocysteine methyltransferase
MFGCVDPGDAPLEPLDDVAAMVREALRYVAPERLLVAPDCGLMRVSRERARAKVQLLAEAAGTVRRSL